MEKIMQETSQKRQLSQQLVDTATGEILSYKSVKGNSDFVMTFRSSYESLRALGLEDAKARVLLDFFLEHMDKENALIVSRETIKDILGWSLPTIDRKIKILKELQFINIMRTGSSNVYYVNANIAWTTWNDKRDYAQFRAMVLVSKKEQRAGKENLQKHLF